MPASKVEAALAWAARGFRVFPLRDNGKRPVWEGWTETATSDPDTIRSWWEGTDYNIGVLTTGLLGVDLDMKEGRDGLAAWRALGGPEDTLTVRTPSGGLHLYFWGADVRLSAGALGAGVDIRSHNGYLVAPGSTIDGVPYQVIRDVPMQRAPAAVVARCQAPAPSRPEAASVPLTDLDTPAALDRARAVIAATPGAERGQQSDAAFRLAARVKDEGVSEIMCALLMMEWAGRCNPPIGAADLEYRIENAYRYGQNRPGAKAPEVQFSGVNIPPPPEMPPPAPAVPQPVQTAMAAFGNAIPASALAPRPHILRRFLMAGDVTTLLAPGGVGKSLLTLTVAAHIAVGASFVDFGNAVGRPAKSIIYNAEDSLDEMSMRLHAICTILALPFEQVSSNIALISGKTHGRFRLAEMNGRVPLLNNEAIDSIIAAASHQDVVLVALDPLNKLHTLQGNDNIEMGVVMEAVERIAEKAHVAVLLSHHVAKASGSNGPKRAGNAEISMGAQSVVNSSRSAFTLLPPDDTDAKMLGLLDVERRLMVRLDDAKSNRWLPSGRATWFRKHGVRLLNGEEVGALEAVDVAAREDERRMFVARLLYQHALAAGGGGISINDAATALAHSDPLFAEAMASSLSGFKEYIKTLLAAPVDLGSGRVMRLVADKSTVKIALA